MITPAPDETNWSQYVKRCRGAAKALAATWALCILIGCQMPGLYFNDLSKQLGVYVCNAIGAVGIMAGIAALIAQQASRCHPPRLLRSGFFWAVVLIVCFLLSITLLFLPFIIGSRWVPMDVPLFGIKIAPTNSSDPIRSAYVVLALVLMIFCAIEFCLLFVAWTHKEEEPVSFSETDGPTSSGSCLKGCIAAFAVCVLVAISLLDLSFIVDGGGLRLKVQSTEPTYPAADIDSQ